MNPADLLRHVIEPVLRQMDLFSDAAAQLLLGTAAQESGLHFLKQINGPALGIYQMEPATHDDIWTNYLWQGRDELAEKVWSASRANGNQKLEDLSSMLIDNLAYATAMCRIHYLRVPETLPAAGDIEGMAAYWKKFFNTPLGRGTEEEFVRNYRRLAEPYLA